jgi:hypothetical protein
MILHTHSDAYYISENEAKIRAGGFFYMGSNAKTDKKLTNGAILIISKVLKHLMSSAAEAEIGELFINAKEGAVLRTTLEELGHKQPPTPSCYCGLFYYCSCCFGCFCRGCCGRYCCCQSQCGCSRHHFWYCGHYR